MDKDKLRDLFIQKLGASGRIISMSKSGYREKNPKSAAIFNANIVATLRGLKEYEKVWFGDLDITKDESALNEIAAETGLDLFVLYEMDGRFENEDNPQVSKHAFKTDGEMTIGPKYEDHFVRDLVSGGIIRKS